MIPPGYNLADISFDTSDPWDTSSLENKELVIFKVPIDFPTLQLSGKKLDSTLKIKNENERSSYIVEQVSDIGELQNMKIIAADASTRKFKIVNAPIKQYYTIKPKISLQLHKNEKPKKTDPANDSSASKKLSSKSKKSRDSPNSDDRKIKKNKF